MFIQFSLEVLNGFCSVFLVWKRELAFQSDEFLLCYRMESRLIF